MDVIAGLTTLDISCGYGHVCFIVTGDTPEAVAKIAAFPIYPVPAGGKTIASTSTSSSSTDASAKDTKKRGKGAAVEVETAPKKKAKGKGK